jgi:hypothetical protein
MRVTWGRRVHTFKYHKKEFLCGDISVGQYMELLEDGSKVIDDLLLEFNEEKPALNSRQMSRMMRILFNGEDIEVSDDIIERVKKPEIEKAKDEEEKKEHDFHILIGKFMREYHGI